MTIKRVFNLISSLIHYKHTDTEQHSVYQHLLLCFIIRGSSITDERLKFQILISNVNIKIVAKF